MGIRESWLLPFTVFKSTLAFLLFFFFFFPPHLPLLLFLALQGTMQCVLFGTSVLVTVGWVVREPGWHVDDQSPMVVAHCGCLFTRRLFARHSFCFRGKHMGSFCTVHMPRTHYTEDERRRRTCKTPVASRRSTTTTTGLNNCRPSALPWSNVCVDRVT